MICTSQRNMLPRHEGRELNKQDMLRILEKLDTYLTGIQRKIKLYSFGGTKFVLTGLRELSKDVDFIVARQDFTALSSSVAELELKDHVRFDLFPDGTLPGFKYASYD